MFRAEPSTQPSARRLLRNTIHISMNREKSYVLGVDDRVYNLNMSSQDRTYGFVRKIASGGMATVFEAIMENESGFSRRVAIKQMHVDRVADDTMRRMFFDEARTASFLHHGNIVQVLDYGFIENEPILVMEFVDGIDASKATSIVHNRRSSIPEGVALHLIAEVAHALTYAHACRDPRGKPLDIVHRDVSPQNILLSWEGDVKLTDFGIALSKQRVERSETGTVKGKIRYMPPEQLQGEHVGPAADIYALGATLHALIAGEPPRVPIDDILMGGAFEPELSDVLSVESTELVLRCMDFEQSQRLTADKVAQIAGRLSLMRLPREGRGALQAWLGDIRDARSESSSPLDDVMGRCISPSWLERPNGSKILVQTQTVKRSLPPGSEVGLEDVPTIRDRPREDARPAHDVLQGGGTTPPTANDTTMKSVSVPARRRRRSMAMLLVVVLVGAGLAATAAYSLATLDLESESETTAIALSNATSSQIQNPSNPEVEAALEGDPSRSSTLTAQEQDAAVTTVSDSSVEAPTQNSSIPEQLQGPPTIDDGGTRRRLSGARTKRPLQPHREKRAGPTAVEQRRAEASGESTSGGRGFVRVGGAQALNGVVRIDGRIMSRRAPAVFEVSLGSHHVEVLDPSGSSALLSRRVEIQERHDRSSPLPVVLRASSSP